MLILYSTFAALIILAGLITLIALNRAGYTDSSETSAIQHIPEDQL